MVKKLNIGCGDDYRDGFINVDGSDTLKKVDKIIKIPNEKLSNALGCGTASHILCNDFLEHHFHFEAIRILEDFYRVLVPNGTIEVRVPDCNYIIMNPLFSMERKLTMLFGGQDIPQGNMEMNESRKKFPEFFCHKYGWNKQRLEIDFEKVGFFVSSIKRVGSNLIILAKK